MEIIIFLALTIGAFFLGSKLGNDLGKEEAYMSQRVALNKAFAGHDSFRHIFGLPGGYMSDLNPKLAGAPLVIIQSSDFLKLVARSKEPDANEKRIKILIEEMVHSKHLADGFTEQDINNLNSIFDRKHGSEADAS